MGTGELMTDIISAETSEDGIISVPVQASTFLSRFSSFSSLFRLGHFLQSFP